MSAKKSWDVQPGRPTRAPQASAAGTRVKISGPVVKRAARVERPKGRLPERRRKQRMLLRCVLTGIGVFVIAAFFFTLWQSSFRIRTISVSGEHEAAIQTRAQELFAGTYFFLIPKDSIFFFPEAQLRETVLTEFPDIAALSVSRTTFTEISITPVPRVSVARWCGAGRDVALPESCYETDANGFIFESVATTTNFEAATSSGIMLYAHLGGEDVSSSTNPIGSHIIQARYLPDLLSFIKSLSSLGITLTAVELRDDEADIYTPRGTRITYVLGREADAYALAQSAFPTLGDIDGGYEYIDLRFMGKAYVKKGVSASRTAT